jgi:hypothetical protein
MVKKHLIQQVSMFTENRPGRLAAFAQAMEEAGIDIYAFSIAEADGFGVIRALVSDPTKACKRLTDLGFMVKITEVIAVGMKDRPGGLREVAEVLGRAEINIDYSYAYSSKHGAVLILRVDKVEDAVKSLKASSVPLLESAEVH